MSSKEYVGCGGGGRERAGLWDRAMVAISAWWAWHFKPRQTAENIFEQGFALGQSSAGGPIEPQEECAAKRAVEL